MRGARNFFERLGLIEGKTRLYVAADNTLLTVQPDEVTVVQQGQVRVRYLIREALIEPYDPASPSYEIVAITRTPKDQFSESIPTHLAVFGSQQRARHELTRMARKLAGAPSGRFPWVRTIAAILVAVVAINAVTSKEPRSAHASPAVAIHPVQSVPEPATAPLPSASSNPKETLTLEDAQAAGLLECTGLH